MFIIKAMIYFSICNLIVNCQDKVNCDVASDAKKCATTIATTGSALNVTCSGSTLAIRVSMGANSADPFSGHSKYIPSINNLWNTCRNNTRGLDDPIDIDRNLTVSVLDSHVTAFPDNYFCHLPAKHIRLNHNLLHDTRKLGFSSLDNCEVQCITIPLELHLDHNMFVKVSNESFCGLERLRDLYINHGQLRELESDAFAHLISLRFISLKDNNISVLPPGVFSQQKSTLTTLLLSKNRLNSSSILEIKNLTHLQHLSLAENHIDVIPEGLFDEMNHLLYLALDNNYIKTLQGALTGLQNLQRLELFNNDISEILHDDLRTLVNLTWIGLDNNPINTFDPDALTNCVNMSSIKMSNTSLATVPNFITTSETFRNLYLSNNKIGHIRVGTFDKGRNVSRIDLSHNQLTDITEVFVNCTAEYLILDHNRITRINLNDFSSRVVTLSLAHNRIHTMDSASHLTLKTRWSLRHILMRHNRLSALNSLSLPPSVVNLDVRNNNISAMSYSDAYFTLVCNRMVATVLDLENNGLTVMDQRLFAPTDAVHYYLRGNPLNCSCENQWLSTSRYVMDRYNLTCQQQQIPKQIKILSNATYNCDVRQYNEAHPVKTCKLWCPTRCKCHNVGKSNIHVECTSKFITVLPLTSPFEFDNVNELRVYLDNNFISKINNNSFDGLHSTVEMYLNLTRLSEMEDGSFDQLTMLELLNLEHNSLTNISPNIFKRLSCLKQLLLSYNQLQTIKPNAFPSQIQILHLDNNELVDYGVWHLNKLTRLWKLSVHANRWSCECKYIEKFHKWLLNYTHVIEEIGEIFCVHESNGTELRVPMMTFDAPHCHDPTVTDLNQFHFNKMLKFMMKYLLNENTH